MDKLELDQVLNLRIDDRTLDMLRSISALDDRSMSATIRYLIRQEHDRRIVEDKPVYSATSDTPAPEMSFYD